ncbi:C39 family peptidase [Desulfatitalea alkaliphila]|uniref:C39 family peptidase n=1 Tax=Desulfatitalea alkaliphila TaxID=2929485 RepID=A0AA41R5E3_9BACT|nr:C39 family peptidase [Desulfatitalea alkaliphila]MCJ8502644.1 C39 family peptidase [Desulfatitalea alkaliphila]
METQLRFDIQAQPDDTTCGPTCLQAVYNYYNDPIPLGRLIRQVEQLEGGGTLAVLLGCHALQRGYRAKIYTFNLQVFDPTWFKLDRAGMQERLERQLRVKNNRKMRTAGQAYLTFLQLGGTLRFEDLTGALIRGLLKRGVPVLTGLSATFLYRTARELEVGREMVYDDIKGEPTGHFVVLCGYNRADRTALVADPLLPNPISESQIYPVRLSRLVCAIMLGIWTYDANLLVITPGKG